MTEQRTGEIAQSYELREGGADLRSLLTLCRPEMRELCTGPEPGDWLEYIYAFLLEKIYPERVKVSERSAREKAVSFYLEVLEEVFERERAELAFDPYRDFRLVGSGGRPVSETAREYEHLREVFNNGHLYAFLRIARTVTPFDTLGHVAGVHHVAMSMALQLERTKTKVDLPMVSGASMIHDIGKFGCRVAEAGRVPYLHYYYTYQFAEKYGMRRIGSLAANHSVWDLELEYLPVESQLLIYADFRVKSIQGKDGGEENHIYTLREAYDVILNKLDNVDEEKRRRYGRVYARLRDFEDYMVSLGCSTDPADWLLTGISEEAPVPVKMNACSLMKPQEVMNTFRHLAISTGLDVMYQLNEERFIGLLESIRSEKDWRHIRAYLTVIDEYSAYLKQAQKEVVLSFLYDMLSHRDGDIRRHAAGTAGRLIARYDVRFTKDTPEGEKQPEIGGKMSEVWRNFLHHMLFPGPMLPEQHRRWIGYAMKTVLRTLLDSVDDAREILQIYTEYYKSVRWDTLTCFFLLNCASEVPLERCNDTQRRLILQFARNFANSDSDENRAAALLFMAHYMEENKPGTVQDMDLNWIDQLSADDEEDPVSICYLVNHLKRLLHPDTVPKKRFSESLLYLENQRSEKPWIFKNIHLKMLRESCFEAKEAGEERDNYQYANHLLNLLQFTDRVVNKIQAGEDLVRAVDLLEVTQKYEIVLELIRAVEMGEYAVSKYIPPCLGRIFLTMPAQEGRMLLSRFHRMVDSANTRVVIVALETMGIILVNLPRERSRMDAAYYEELESSVEGMICCGIAHFRMEVSEEALYAFGHGVFGSKELSLADKKQYFRRLGRRILSFKDWEDEDLYDYYDAAALNHIYQFLIECEEDTESMADETAAKEEALPVAFFPGTFDPFSLGHKAIVDEIASMGFEVYLSTDEFSWSKRTQPFKVRQKIVAMSIADLADVYLFPESIPINIANPKDLMMLKEVFAGREVYMVAGSDVVENASAYRAPETPNSIHTFPHILFTRNTDQDDMEQRSAGDRISAQVLYLKLPAYYETMSSTKIRENVSTSKDIANLVEIRVQNYIYDRNLYSMEPLYKKAARSRVVDTEFYRTITEDLAQELGAEGFLPKAPFKQRDKVAVIRDEEKKICGAVYYHSVGVSDLFDECGDIGLTAKLRKKVSGKIIMITGLFGSKDAFMDNRITVLNEMLTKCQEDGCSYAVSLNREEEPENIETEENSAASAVPLTAEQILTLFGFISPEGMGGCYMVNLCSPMVLFFDTESFLKEPFAESDVIRSRIWRRHLRLCREAAGLYPGNLLLCFESDVMNYRLATHIMEGNPWPEVSYTKRKLARKMCVPFGKILKGVLIPGCVTKDLNTEKLYDADLEGFEIREFPQYLPISVQIRTIRSFDRPILLVDDIYHKGFRMAAIGKHLQQEQVQIDRLVVGVMSGQGNDLAHERNLTVDPVYFIPNMRSWLIESDLYPFIGGDGVQGWEEDGSYQPTLRSINPILPYEMPNFMRDVPKAKLYQLSRVCIENARDIYLTVEREYQKKYGRKLTMERISEVSAEPRNPDSTIINTETLGKSPSELLNRELQKLHRLRHLRQDQAESQVVFRTR